MRIVNRVMYDHAGIAPYECVVKGVRIWEPYSTEGLYERVSKVLKQSDASKKKRNR